MQSRKASGYNAFSGLRARANGEDSAEGLIQGTAEATGNNALPLVPELIMGAYTRQIMAA